MRIYLDNALVGAAVQVGADGSWNMTTAGIVPKIYTLRVDEVDAAGKVTSRYETPFKRETPETLAAASGAAAVAATASDAAAEAGTTVAASAAATATNATTPTVAAKPALVTVTVQPGFTLWGIAKRQMGHGILYVQVWNANKDKIRNPDMIYPGQVFALPKS